MSRYPEKTVKKKDMQGKTREDVSDRVEDDECPHPTVTGFKNCDLDCVYHKKKEKEDVDGTCKCTNVEIAGIIQARDFCAYKKEATITVPDIETCV